MNEDIVAYCTSESFRAFDLITLPRVSECMLKPVVLCLTSDNINFASAVAYRAVLYELLAGCLCPALTPAACVNAPVTLWQDPLAILDAACRLPTLEVI